MKTLGLIGGMSWESTIEYYRVINKLINERLGGWNSAKLFLCSVNFEEILALQKDGKWEEIANIMIDISKNLEKIGSSAIVICSNTMHKIANEIEKQINIPLIHVVDETANKIKSEMIETIGLLGTNFTMEGGFYKERLVNKYGLKVILPEKVNRDYIHSTIYNELAQGDFKTSTKEKFIEIINELTIRGAQGVIMGCTEIPLLIKQEDVDIRLFDTLKIHLEAAIDFALI